MNEEFPSAVPEMPVGNLSKAVSYYENCLGFEGQGGADGGGFSQVCRGSCRLSNRPRLSPALRTSGSASGDLAQPQQQERGR